MDDLLQQLNHVRGVGGSVLVSSEGLPVAAAVRGDADENRLAAAVGAALEHAGRLAAAADLGRVTGLNAGGEHGSLLVLSAGKAQLAVIADASANQALLALETRPYVERIAKRLTL